MSSHSLPTRVAPRSRSVGRPSREDDRHYETQARSPLPSNPRMASSQSSRTQGRPHPPRQRMDDTRTLSSSTSSSSTSAYSFLDRMKARSGETSSRTSLDDDYEEPPKRGGGWAPTRGRRPPPPAEARYDRENPDQESTSITSQVSGPGYDLWGRVTAVAGNLTVNVGKALERGIHLADGEETPPGQESRLTQAMKAYHLGRARSPTDLPSWLFDEHERGVLPRSRGVSEAEEYEDRFLPDPDPRQRSGLRDVYDKAAASSPPTASATKKAATSRIDGTDGGSRAENRLKAIREAKRSGLQARSRPDMPPQDDHRGDMASPRQGPPTRVGLPAGPGRIRRQ